MKSLRKALIGACLLMTSALTPAALAPSYAIAAEMPASFADLVEKLTPAVVNISSIQKVKTSNSPGLQLFGMPDGDVPQDFQDFFDQFLRQQQGGKEGKGNKGAKRFKRPEPEAYALGSGFIIDESGYVVTNNHVVADAEEVKVILSDDTELKAKIIGRDTKTDLALLKVDAGHKLPAVTLGDSDAARVGDWVLAIGNPFGLGGTVTAGIISARGRNINSGPFDDFIQTDAAINRGNSGGPMFNAKGEVIGINTAIFSPSGGGSVGIGFAVPMSLAKPIIEQLKTSGHIQRGLLGVKIQRVTEEMADSVGLAKPHGALVTEVIKDGPAEKAGIKVGDIITSFDGKEVKEMRFLPRMVAETKIGKKAEVGFWRGGKAQTVLVDIAKMNEQDKDSESANGDDDNAPQGDTADAAKTKDMLALSLANLTPDLRTRYDIAKDVKGVLVVNVKEGSEAYKRGFQPGDVVMQIGDTPVENVQAALDAVAQARKAGRKFAMVRVLRGADSAFETLPLDEKKKEKE